MVGSRGSRADHGRFLAEPRSGCSPHSNQDRGRPGPASGKLLLRTGGACDLDPEHLLDVLGEQRQRFVTVLQGFGPDDWAAPTRCADWSAHDVVRHLCDGNAIATGTDDRTLDISVGFDPRITPRGWLAASADESPDATLGRLVATTEELLVLARARLAQSLSFDVRLPYGPMDWTVLVLHAFWDSWIHERDVLLARGTEHPTDDDATVYATAYGLFIAAAVASMFGDRVQEKLKLGGAAAASSIWTAAAPSRSPSTESPLRGRPQPRSRTRSPAAHWSPPRSAICRPARVPLCRASPTSSTRLSSRARPENPREMEAEPSWQASVKCPGCWYARRNLRVR